MRRLGRQPIREGEPISLLVRSKQGEMMPLPRHPKGSFRMVDAPRTGELITAYVQETLRSVRVSWNGRYWVEENGEKWSSSQLVGWNA